MDQYPTHQIKKPLADGIDTQPPGLETEVTISSVLEAFSRTGTAQLESYTYLSGDKAERDAQKSAFLAGEIVNPKLDTPKLDTETISAFGHQTQELYSIARNALLLGGNSDSLEEQRVRIVEGIVGTALLERELLALSVESRSDDSETAMQSAKHFNEANDILYGPLESDKFLGLVVELRERAETLLGEDSNTSDEVKQVAMELLEQLPEIDVHAVEIKRRVEPTPVQLVALKEMIFEGYGDIIAIVEQYEDKAVYTADDLVFIFSEAHKLRNTGWQVRIDEEKTSVSSDQETKTTNIGAGRECKSKSEIIEVLVHENGVHVERSLRASQSDDELLSAGRLAGYLAAEEGLATAFEQIIRGVPKDSGVHYYTALGLARGLDGKPRDFRDVFEIMWRKHVVDTAFTGKEVNLESQRNTAYANTERIFRGSPCDMPGVVYTKDQSYFIGNQKIWELLIPLGNLSEEDQSIELGYLLAGKFNPTDPTHVALVKSVLEKQRQLTGSVE